MKKEPFGKTPSGEPIDLFTLVSPNGLEARIMNWGAIVVSLIAPDRAGSPADVVLGFDDLQGYIERNTPYFGAIIGRYANRIADGRFSLDGVAYQLTRNNGKNCLHGGRIGFDKRVWTAREIPGADDSIQFSYLSPDGEENFPGNLSVRVLYTVTRDNELRLDYSAECDRDTVVSLTNHSYFNLSGEGTPTVLDHELTLHSSLFAPTDDTQIPTGEVRPVEGTPFDFRKPRRVGARIEDPDEQMRIGSGYDHGFVVDGEPGALRPVARVYDPKSRRVLETSSTEPAVQFYSANFLDGTIPGKGGRRYARRSALCLETGHLADSPNKPVFPSTVLRAGETLLSRTIYKFSAE